MIVSCSQEIALTIVRISEYRTIRSCLGDLIVVLIVRISCYPSQGICFLYNIASDIVFVDSYMLQSVCRSLDPVGKIVIKLYPSAIGIDSRYKPAVVVILVPCYLCSVVRLDFCYVMAVIILEGCVISANIIHLGKVTVVVVGIGYCIPQAV